MNRTVNKGRLAVLAVIIVILLFVYIAFLYDLQIIQGEEYYLRSSETKVKDETVPASRGNILDRYGRVLVSNEECYNLTIDVTKLFADGSEAANKTILDLINLVGEHGDVYIDDLPITKAPPFEYTEMTEIQKNMLEAYFRDKAKEGLSTDTTAVELMSYMRTRYDIPNDFSAEDMRKVCGLRYSINVRYAINTSEYVFVEDASMGLIATIMERKLDGIEVKRAYTRVYNTNYAAHLLGYVGLMTQEEYEKYSLVDYANDAMVGKDGVEYTFEDYLHGQEGEVKVTTTADGTILSQYYTKDPIPGNNVYLTIDITLQEATERALASGIEALIATREVEMQEFAARGEPYPEKYEITGASAVVMDVKTGEPLALASWPTYNPATVVEDYADLMKADNTPLFNRTLLGAYAPGSCFKPCTAIACLSEGIINTEDKIKCEGVFTRYAAEGYAPECWIWSSYQWTHDEENVTTAVRDSCNYFFYTIVNDLGVDLLGKYAHDFGLGSSTGIELIETTGNMANRENHMDYAGAVWRIGDTLQAGIGQSDSIFTPLQMGVYCSTIANSGTRYSASILKQVRNYDYSEQIYERKSEVLATVKSARFNWDAVQDGMWRVANEPGGTGYETWFDYPYQVAAKTGTAQKGENIVNDGIFMCYAPYRDPQVAIAIIVERGGSGSAVSFIARNILDVYFNIQSYSDTQEREMALLR